MHAVPPRVVAPDRATPGPVQRSERGVAPSPRSGGLSSLTVAAITLFCTGASLASAAYFALLPDIRQFVDTNVLAQEERRRFVLWILLGGVSACAIPLPWLIKRPHARTVAGIATLADIMSPAMLAFVVPLLFRFEVFAEKELLCLIVATLFGLLLERAFRRCYGAIAALGIVGPMPWRAVRAQQRIVRFAVVGLMLFFCGYFSYYTVLHHYQLETRSYDLAIFDNMMWNLIRGKWFKAAPVLGRTGSHIRYHATFDAYLFAPFYALRQKADTLLVLQAVVAGGAVVPIYLVTKRKLGSALGALVLAYAYVVHAPLHGPLFYDFHFITTASFFVSWVLYFFETRRNGWLVVSWIAAVLLREEISAGIAMACMFYLASNQRPRLALLGGLVSSACFLLIKFVIMPLHSPSGDQAFTYVYAELIPAGESGFGPVIKTLLSNPVFTLNKMIIPEKFAYLMKIMTPVLFLPFRHARAWVLLLVPAVFTLLSTGYAPVIQTYFQYTSIWTAYLFFGAAVTLASWRSRPDAKVRIAAALSAVLVTATALSYNFGAIFQHRNFRGGFSQVSFVWNEFYGKQLRDLDELIAMIPRDASVAATETEAPHVSNRANCFTMRGTVQDPDYLLVSLSEVLGEGESRHNMLTALQTGDYSFLGTRGHFALWGKGASHEHDKEGKVLLNLPPEG